MSFEDRAHARYGGRILSDTSAYTGNWAGFQVITDTVIASITAAKVTNISAITTETLSAGNTYAIPCTAITLTSGKLYMINDENG